MASHYPKQPAKFLGTWIDDRLVWTEHVTHLKTKLTKRLGLLKCSKKFLSMHAMKILYYAQINSHIAYGISMWGPMVNHCLINQIQNLQDKAVKCIDLRLKKNEMYCVHKILNIDQMIELELCKLGYRLTNNLLPKLLSEALLADQHNRSLTKMHKYDTRHKVVPNLPKATHSKYRNSYLFQAVSLYSKLPDCITKQLCVKGFTSKCKDYLIDRDSC